MRRITSAWLLAALAFTALALTFLMLPSGEALGQQIAPLADKAARDIGNVTGNIERVAWQIGGLMVVIFALISVVSGRINWKIALMGLLALYLLSSWRDLIDFMRGI